MLLDVASRDIRAPHFGLVLQHGQHEQLVHRADQDKLLAAKQDAAGDPFEPLVCQTVLDQLERLLADIAIGCEVVSLVRKVQRVHGLCGQDRVHLEHPLAAQLFNFLRLDDHVLPVGKLEAAHDFVLGHLAMHGARLFVLDATVAFVVQLVQRDAPLPAIGRVPFHGNRYEA